MSQKRYRPEENIAKLREAEVLLGQGTGDHRTARTSHSKASRPDAHTRTGYRSIIGSGPTNGVRSSLGHVAPSHRFARAPRSPSRSLFLPARLARDRPRKVRTQQRRLRDMLRDIQPHGLSSQQ